MTQVDDDFAPFFGASAESDGNDAVTVLLEVLSVLFSRRLKKANDDLLVFLLESMLLASDEASSVCCLPMGSFSSSTSEL